MNPTNMIAAALLTALLAALPHPARADCGPQPAATVPLLSDGRPMILATINGRPIELLVDTGASRSTVTPETAAALHLRRDRFHRTIAASIGGRDTVPNAIVDTLVIGALPFQQLSFAVIPVENTQGGPGGILGTDVSSHFDLELDLARRSLAFYWAGACKITHPPWDGRYQTFHVTISDRNALLFPVQLNGHPITAVFDTGSVGETITRRAANGIGLSDAQIDSDPASSGISGGGHPYAIHRHKFESIKIGAESFAGPSMDIVDFDHGDIGMLLGVNYMKRRRFFLSYSSSTLFIQPTAGQPPPAGVTPPPPGDPSFPCRPPPELIAALAPAPPVAISRPPPGAPDKAKAAHVSGCAGIKFHLSADGTPTDITPVVENPPGYGFGAVAQHQVAASKFRPDPGASGWYYQAHRFNVP